MKRYIFAICALIIAIGAAAFTRPANNLKQGSFIFHYTPSTYGQMTVQTNGSWASGAATCASGSNKACEIQVDAAYTHTVGSSRVLNTSGANVVNIVAVPGSNGTDYVPDATDVNSKGFSSPTDKN